VTLLVLTFGILAAIIDEVEVYWAAASLPSSDFLPIMFQLGVTYFMRSCLTLDCTNTEEAPQKFKRTLKHNKYQSLYRLHLYSNNRLKFRFAMQYRRMVNKLYSMNKDVHGENALSFIIQAYW